MRLQEQKRDGEPGRDGQQEIGPSQSLKGAGRWVGAEGGGRE